MEGAERDMPPPTTIIIFQIEITQEYNLPQIYDSVKICPLKNSKPPKIWMAQLAQ